MQEVVELKDSPETAAVPKAQLDATLDMNERCNVREKRKEAREPSEVLAMASSFIDTTPEPKKLDELVTKAVPALDDSGLQSQTSEAGLHEQHYRETADQIKYIMANVQEPSEAPDLFKLPDPLPNQKKLLVLDMDETLIHCVDDVEKQTSDVILALDFSGDQAEEDTVYAGINVRPHALDCLRAASASFQIVVFTASHQVYADAILDYLESQMEAPSPIAARLYRQHCTQTPDGLYVKDLRMFTG